MNDQNIFFIKYGKPNASPIIVLHGFPGSAKHCLFFQAFAAEFNVEIYSIDRPGYGQTLPLDEKGIAGFIPLFEKFISQNNFSNFSVIGVSGGAPYAVAIAEKFSDKVSKLGIICGLGPWEDHKFFFSFAQNVAFTLYKNLPESMMDYIIAKAFVTVDYDDKLNKLASTLNDADKKILSNPEVKKTMIEGMIDARLQGLVGIKNDLYQYCRPWHIDWSKIQMPSFVWYGSEDLMLNPKMAEIFKEKIPHALIKYFPGEGHFSLPILHARTILEDFTTRNT